MAALLGASVQAAPSPWDSLQVHGFAAQAAIKTTANRWFGPSDGTSLDFTEVALNASVRLAPPLLLSGQILSRRAGEMYDGSPTIDYAVADITLLDSPARRAGLRLGRLKNPLGLYNETRDVPFTHPGIFLPQVVYFDRVRNSALSTDGVMVYGHTYNDFGNLSLTVGNGKAVIDENVEWAYLNGDYPGDVNTVNNSSLASVWYSSPSERLKLGLSGISLSIEFHPDPGAPVTLSPGRTDIRYWIASAQYNAEDWTLTSEYMREPLDWHAYGPSSPDRKGVAEGYYVQGTYRLRHSVELMLRYEEGFADRKDRDGRAAAQATRGLIPPFNGYSKILSAGIQWDINQDWMIRAQYGHNEGTFALSPRENRDPASLEKYWDLFALQVVFRF